MHEVYIVYSGNDGECRKFHPTHCIHISVKFERPITQYTDVLCSTNASPNFREIWYQHVMHCQNVVRIGTVNLDVYTRSRLTISGQWHLRSQKFPGCLGMKFLGCFLIPWNIFSDSLKTHHLWTSQFLGLSLAVSFPRRRRRISNVGVPSGATWILPEPFWTAHGQCMGLGDEKQIDSSWWNIVNQMNLLFLFLSGPCF